MHTLAACAFIHGAVSPGWICFNRENVTTIKGVKEALSFVETDVELAMTEMTDTLVRRCKHQEIQVQVLYFRFYSCSCVRRTQRE